MFIKIGKQESRLLRWLRRAIGKDDARPVLQGINIDGNGPVAIAADGWRLHAIPSSLLPELNDELPPGDNLIKLPPVNNSENVVELAFITDGNYPDVEGIIPTGEIQAEIHFNPKFMIDALRELDKDEPVRLVLYGEMKPFEVHGQISGYPVYALVMGMHVPDNSEQKKALSWRVGDDYDDGYGYD